MSAWQLTQLTFGSDRGLFHAHSYYDIPVIDGPGRRIVAHRLRFIERQPTPEDAIEVGLVDVDRPGSWTALGESRAWSWQQGPMAQWIAGGPRLVWNDRDGDRFVARLVDVERGTLRTLPAPVYAVDPEGRFALSLNMARLDALRPGYGYAGGSGALLEQACPGHDGVWRLPLAGGAPELILPLERAVRFLRTRLGLRRRLRHLLARYHYWFNHAKISPDGQRFTMKLRWRRRGGPWFEAMGVSLTCGVDGSDLRLLADATSHVIWLDEKLAYCWRKGEVALFEDRAPAGVRVGAVAPGLIDSNAHIRHLPSRAPGGRRLFLFDTPYREQVELRLHDPVAGTATEIARFAGHVPARGPFRCDLHPCPSADGARIVVTSPQDGGRQLYVLTHAGLHGCAKSGREPTSAALLEAAGLDRDPVSTVAAS